MIHVARTAISGASEADDLLWLLAQHKFT